jgi:hypothetical protein
LTVKLEHSEKHYKKKQDETIRQYSATLKLEREKYDRRLAGFYQRINAKNEELARLEETMERKTQSAPTSPVSSTFIARRPVDVSKIVYDDALKEQKKKISELTLAHEQHVNILQHDMETKYEQLKQQLQYQHTEQLREMCEALKSEHKGKSDEFSNLVNALTQEKHAHLDKLTHFEALKEQIALDHERELNRYRTKMDDLEAKMQEMKEKHTSKILQMNENFDASQARLKELYVYENQQITMQCEARIENMVTEQKHALQELEASCENQKEVIRIEYQSKMDRQARSQANKVYQTERNLETVSHQLNHALERLKVVEMDNKKLKKEKSRLEFQCLDVRLGASMWYRFCSTIFFFFFFFTNYSYKENMRMQNVSQAISCLYQMILFNIYQIKTLESRIY